MKITRRSALLLFLGAVVGCTEPEPNGSGNALVDGPGNTKTRGRKIYRNFVWRRVLRGPNRNRRQMLLVISRFVQPGDQVVIKNVVWDVKAMRPGKMDISNAKEKKTINTFLNKTLKDDGEPIA